MLTTRDSVIPEAGFMVEQAGYEEEILWNTGGKKGWIERVVNRN